MIFQLTVFSLLLLFLMLLGQFIAPGGSAGAGQGRGAPRSMIERGERLNSVIRDAARIYVLFAPFALLLYLQGKPDLLPQYLGWIVVAAELAKGLALFLGKVMPARFLGVINVAILIFLWLQELPIFQSNPA